MSKSIFNRNNVLLTISATAIGIMAGVSSLSLSLFLEFIEKLFLNFNESATIPSAVNSSETNRLLSVFIGSIIAAIVWSLIRSKLKPVVSINKALNGEKMPWFQTLIDVLIQIFFVGTGGSIGRELAPRESASMFAQLWETMLNKIGLNSLTEDDKKLLVAAAAGAGFAGIYISPITGMFFSVEILLKKMTPKTVSVSLYASIIAMLIGSIVKGFKPYYLINDSKFTISILPFVIIASPLIGLIGGIFRKSFQWAEKNQTKNLSSLWQLPLIGLLTGIIAMKFPQIMGNGRALAQLSMNSINGKMLIYVLLFGAIAKAVVTVFTIRDGAAGGTLTPSISIGAAIGVLIALIFNIFGFGFSFAQVAVLSAAFLLAASQQAPLMAMFMIFEVTHLDYSAFLPLGLGVILSFNVSKIFLNHSIKWKFIAEK
jgi:H+/Cl- antiporter ClcA